MRRPAFTLIELIITITILALLSYLGAAAYLHLRERSKLARVSADLFDMGSAVTQYVQDNNYQYPADVSRGMPNGLEKYLAGGVWPKSIWAHGLFDWDNWTNNGQQVYQITYHLCDVNDPIEYCSDPVLFPTFVRDSGIFYCISGPCIPHQNEPTIPGYCVNCTIKKVNY